MIQVHMRRETKDMPEKIFNYPFGDTTYTQDGWLYVIDDDGKILGCHPEQNVNGVLNKAGESIVDSENPDRPGKA